MTAPDNAPTNADIIAFLQRHASLMELSGQSGFRVRAFDNAARMLEDLEVDVVEMSAAQTLTEIDGIGKGLADFIAEFIEFGTTAGYAALTETVPETLLDLLRIPGLGTKKVKAIHAALEIASLVELAEACQDGRLDGLAGFGKKTQENILKGIAVLSRYQGQYRLDHALADAQQLIVHLEAHPATIRVSFAGSLRRHKEVVKDVDIVLSTDAPADVAAAFAALPQVVEVLAQGDRKTTVRLKSGIQVDLRLVPDEHYASMLHHFTGSKDHNVAMRSRALSRDLHLNEYGLFHGKKGDGERINTEDETELFRALELTCVPPELREGLGELEAGETDTLPVLLQAADVRGMLHVHTSASDGSDTIAEMAAAVRQRGFDYVCICDHSKSAGYVFGLKESDIETQHAEIDALQEEQANFRILKGIESDILRNGALDYPDEVLKKFDLVVIAIHNTLAMDEVALTARVVKAIEHPATNIFAHPTGRMLLEREGYRINLEEVINAAAANNVALELNTHPARFDLDWRWLRRARDAGCRIAVNTDAHRISDLDSLELGAGIARKGWLTPADVINTMSADQLLTWANG
jgi:DNA polymerase (family 10)